MSPRNRTQIPASYDFLYRKLISIVSEMLNYSFKSPAQTRSEGSEPYASKSAVRLLCELCKWMIISPGLDVSTSITQARRKTRRVCWLLERISNSQSRIRNVNTQRFSVTTKLNSSVPNLHWCTLMTML